MSHFPKLGEVLIRQGLISQAQLDQALEIQKTSDQKIGEVLVSLKVISQSQLAKAIGNATGLLAIDLSKVKSDPTATTHIERELCESHRLVPVMFKEIQGKDHLVIAFADPFDLNVLEEIRFRTNMPIYRVVATLSDIQAHITKLYTVHAPDESEAETLSMPEYDVVPEASRRALTHALVSLAETLKEKNILTQGELAHLTDMLKAMP